MSGPIIEIWLFLALDLEHAFPRSRRILCAEIIFPRSRRRSHVFLLYLLLVLQAALVIIVCTAYQYQVD
jgi:hypothetical protein